MKRCNLKAVQSLALVLLLAPLFMTGCVSKSKFTEKVAEANDLEATVSTLQDQALDLKERITTLSNQKSDLEQRLEEALSDNAALQQDLIRARADIDRLEQILSARSAEAGAALAEMRQTIDQLSEHNRELAARLEKEKVAREARLALMKSTYDELVENMEAEIERGEVTISELQGKLTVNMVERILFDTGKAEIKTAGLDVLRRVGDILKTVEDKHIRIEGHTDNVPISSRLKEKFPSNWELSTARATNVVHFLQDQIDIPGERLSATGFGPYQPLADNSTPEGRALNRRIQIVLVPQEAQISRPLPDAAQ